MPLGMTSTSSPLISGLWPPCGLPLPCLALGEIPGLILGEAPWGLALSGNLLGLVLTPTSCHTQEERGLLESGGVGWGCRGLAPLWCYLDEVLCPQEEGPRLLC